MNTEEIIRAIHESKKTTPVKLYLREKEPIPFENVKSFGVGDRIVFGDWADIGPMLEKYADRIEDYVVESDRRNSAIPLLDAKNLRARIEPGAITAPMLITAPAPMPIMPKNALPWKRSWLFSTSEEAMNGVPIRM